MTRFGSLVAACGLVLTACPPGPSQVDAGTDGGIRCIDKRDCPDPNLFECDTISGVCVVGCTRNDHCNNRGTHALDYCPTGQDKCLCDEFQCVAKRCSADVDCGGSLACRDGDCVTAPAASDVDTCEITPRMVVLKQGAKVKFSVLAKKASGDPVVVKDGATWSAPSGSPLMVGSSTTGTSVELTASSPTTGTVAVEAVQAAFGSKICTAKAIVLAAPAANTLGVIMTDELSGTPVKGATVVISDGTTGVSLATATTDDRGLASLNLAPQGAPAIAGPFTVTSFHKDYTYITVGRYTPSAGADARMLHVVSRRNQVDKYGGYKGTFSNVPQTDRIHAGFTGMSIPGSITGVSIAQLLGPTIETDIMVGMLMQNDVPIPAGAYLGFGEQKVRDNFSSQGLAGTCGDEAKTAAGTCGTRAGWALAGDIPLGDVVKVVEQVRGGGSLDVAAILGNILPVFKLFNSSVRRDIEFNLIETPRTDGEYNFSDVSHFTTADHDFTKMPLSFAFAVKLPTLPRFRNEFANGALLIGGANTPGRGVVPLGIGVGVDNATPRNGLTDPQLGLTAENMVQMRMAPAHSGLEGAGYGLLIAALSTTSIDDVSAGIGASAIFPKLPMNQLKFDPTGSAPIDVSGLAFPPFPEGLKVNYGANAVQGLPSRALRFSAALMSVGVVRVVFTDGLERRWEVLLDPAQATSAIVLPTPPTGAAMLTDRLFADNMTGGKRASVAVQTFNLNTEGGVISGGTPVGFTQFVEANSTNADNVTSMLQSFAFVDRGAPTIGISKPEGGSMMGMPASVAKGSELMVEVSAFKVGTTGADDGVVRLRFSINGAPAPGCGSNGAVNLTAETTAGNGELVYALPMACTGALRVDAELMDPTGTTALDPAVSTTKYITVAP